MRTLFNFVVGSILILCLIDSAVGQDNGPANGARAGLTVTASASSDRVRFTAPSSVVQVRLEVYNSRGRKVFDNEVRSGNMLDWHLQDGQADPLSDDTYLCAVTVKSLSGRLAQRIAFLILEKASVQLKAIDVSQMTAQQSEAIGPVEENTSLTLLDADEQRTTTVVAHNGEEGTITRGRGALSFRLGDFFSGKDREQMRLTAEGNLGIGVSHPQVRLDVDGLFHTSRGVVFPDGTIQFSAASRTLGARSSRSGETSIDKQEIQPQASGTGTQNFIPRWTDNVGTLGDSLLFQSSGKIGIGTANPLTRLHVGSGAAPPVTLGAALLVEDGPNTSMVMKSTTGGEMFFFQNSVGGVIGTASNSYLSIRTANQDRMMIDTAGNIGIGTVLPTTKLQVLASGNHAVQGKSDIGIGVWGETTGQSGAGVYGSTAVDSGVGVQGQTTGPFARSVFGAATGLLATGVMGQSTAGDGVFGTGQRYGVHGQSSSASAGGVWGESSAAGYGVIGVSASGVGVYGRSDSGNDGVVGESHVANRSGVYGFTTDANGCGGCFQNQAGGRALGVTGNAVQSRDGGGIVKAMALINPFTPQPIVRCYNSQLTGSAATTPPCGLTYSPQQVGHYIIDFGFQVDDRFVLVTPLFEGSFVRVAVIDPRNVTANQIRVRTKRLDESDSDNSFYLFVF